MKTGEVVVVEDEGDKPLYLALPQKSSTSGVLEMGKSFSAGIQVDDLEGITSAGDSTLIAVTSHSITKKGKRKGEREQLLKLKVSSGGVTFAGGTGSLKPYILKRLERLPGIDAGLADTLNIEGLSFDQTGQKLLIGLRAPTLNGRAIILQLLNPFALFESKEPPQFSDQVFLLDIGGNGIRALEYFHQFDRYLMASEAMNKKGKLRSIVWAWDGRLESAPTKVGLQKLKGTKNIEGLSPFQHRGKRFLLMVCDDGDQDKDKSAHYVLIPVAKVAF